MDEYGGVILKGIIFGVVCWSAPYENVFVVMRQPFVCCEYDMELQPIGLVKWWGDGEIGNSLQKSKCVVP